MIARQASNAPIDSSVNFVLIDNVPTIRTPCVFKAKQALPGNDKAMLTTRPGFV
jgi:hypothetical protein